MTFDELLGEACDSAHLPEMARLLLPSTLSEETKRMVLKLTPEEFGQVLATTIDTVNRGAVESIDSLVRKLLER